MNADVISVAHNLIDCGLPIVLADRHPAPGREKAPIDLRPYDQQTEGSGWRAHTSDHGELDAWADTAESRSIALNAGVALTGDPGHIIVIDLDTATAVSAWHALVDECGGSPLPLTTHSPGKKDEEGAWIHQGGGHVYLRVPEGLDIRKFPGTVHLGETAGADAVDVKLHSAWVMTPPSVRAEGPYTWATDDGTMPAIETIPDWLVEELDWQAIASETPRRASVYTSHDTQRRITEWETTRSWAEILTPLGWTDSGRTDRCGCPIYSRDGGSSWRSGIAHEGCDHSVGHVLHAFSTADDGVIGDYLRRHGRTRVSKLDATALAFYGGSRRSAMHGERIIDPLAERPTSPALVARTARSLDDVLALAGITSPTPQNRPTIAVETFSDSPRGTSTPTAHNASTTATDPIPTIVRQTPRSEGWDFPEETVPTPLYLPGTIDSTPTERPIMTQHSLINPVHPLPKAIQPISPGRYLCSDGQTRDALLDGTLVTSAEAMDHAMRGALGVPQIAYARY